jgi:MFS superfamily sulfate permease-like transporter
MFVGHFGVALASKRAAPQVSLGWLFAACQLADLLWPVLVLAGVEHFRIDPGNTAVTPIAFDHYPWSHSLVMNVLEGAALGAIYFALRRDRRGALVIALLVVSHWVLDWITHRPDMPLAPWSDVKLGLGLWSSVAATVVVETVSRRRVPKGREVYEINGPFFFGAAELFKDTLAQVAGKPKVLIIRMRSVLALDSTGMHALKDVVHRSRKDGTVVLLSDVHMQPLVALTGSPVLEEMGRENLFGNLDDALNRARRLVGVEEEPADAA